MLNAAKRGEASDPRMGSILRNMADSSSVAQILRFAQDDKPA
jgi:hypothetical protein